MDVEKVLEVLKKYDIEDEKELEIILNFTFELRELFLTIEEFIDLMEDDYIPKA